MVYGSPLKIIGCFIALMVIAFMNVAQGEIFSTWEGLEADKCASIWLIKRFIDPAAEIRFYPKGKAITEGIPFDTPEASLRRYHNKSTFETLLEHYQINDAKLVYIGRIMHDIEVNIWEKKLMAESLQVESDIQAIDSQGATEKIIEQCRLYFDRLYEVCCNR